MSNVARRRRVLEVELNGYGSLVSGHGSRELVILITGRPPVWSSIRRGWSVQEKTAADVIAAAEIRNYDIVITGRRAAAAQATPGYQRGVSGAGFPAPDPGCGLW